MSSDDDNDDEDSVTLDVVTVDADNASALAIQLEGSTHIRCISVALYDYGPVERVDDVLDRWLPFCQVACTWPLLDEMDICLYSSSELEYAVMKLLLQYTQQQISQLEIRNVDDPVSASFFTYLTQGIADHGQLEELSLEGFHRATPVGAFGDFIPALSSIHYLNRLSLDPYNFEAYHGGDKSAMVDGLSLARLLVSLPALEDLTLYLFDFNDTHSELLLEALRSPESSCLRKLHVRCCDMTVPCLASLVEGVAGHESLKKLLLTGIEVDDDDRNDDTTAATRQLLAPLSRNTSLDDLEVSLYFAHDEAWPRFDFLRDNTTIKSLLVEDTTPEICAALCHTLGTSNRSLENLTLQGGGDDHADALFQMIRDNVSLKQFHYLDQQISGAKLLEFVPALAQNTTLELCHVKHCSHGTKVDSADTAAFVKGVLRESRLKALLVGHCNAEHMESLVPCMAQNYHLEKLAFAVVSSRTPEQEEEEERLADTMQVIGTLNEFGRRYIKERGPECKVAGVALLAAVNDDLDCLYYHLRENPALCHRGGGTRTEEGRRSMSFQQHSRTATKRRRTTSG